MVEEYDMWTGEQIDEYDRLEMLSLFTNIQKCTVKYYVDYYVLLLITT